MFVRAGCSLCFSFCPFLPTPLSTSSNPGDTLSEIAARYHVSIQSLARANGIQNVNPVPAGQALNIPQPVHRVY